jgi:hypothetical protein
MQLRWKGLPEVKNIFCLEAVFSSNLHVNFYMSTAQIKEAIAKELKDADAATLKDFYGLIKTIKQQKQTQRWEDLTPLQKNQIETGLKQMKEGKGINARKFTLSLQKKYGLKA